MDMTLADVFKSDLFRTTTLAAAVDRVPYVPGWISKQGIFEEDGVNTTSMVIERRGQVLALAPTKPRGAAGTPIVSDKRDAVSFEIPHVPLTASITPDELQNVRGFGTPQMLSGVQEKRDELMVKMGRTQDMTLEYHRLGAIGGVVHDANGDPLFDLFDIFGLEQPDPIPLMLTDAWTADNGGVVRARITSGVRHVRDALGGNEPTGYIGLCADDFFDKIVNHPEVRQTYMAQQAANDLRDGDPIDAVRYGNVTFVNYRGIGAVKVPDGRCRIIPKGVPGLFITRFAPAPWFSAVNQKGKARYAMATLDPSGEKEITIEQQSNPINLCTRPDCLYEFSITD